MTGPIVVTGLEADPLDSSVLVAQIRRADCGAVVAFEGRARTPNGGRDVSLLEYEADEERANRQLDAFARDVVAVHDLGGVVAVHRLGRVAAGDPSVVVAVAAPHRDAALQAASELIERIKTEAAIWKKEILADGHAAWVVTEQRQDRLDGKIRVLVVDDHGMARRGMRAYLEMFPDIVLIGEASGGQEAIDGIEALAARGHAPDVVVMDLRMPGMDGIAAISAVRERHPGVQVVAISSDSAGEQVLAALQAGAVGYILKDADADELWTAIRAAQDGEVYLAPDAAVQLARALRDPTPEAGGVRLTDRERQVLALVAEGASNKAIATTLSISERTARTHVSNILMKLGLGSRTQAALWAVRESRGTGD